MHLQVKARDAMADGDFGLADIAREGAEQAVSFFVRLYIVTNLYAAVAGTRIVSTRPIPLHLT